MRALFLGLAFVPTAGGPWTDSTAPVLALRAGEVHTVSGSRLENAVVLVRDGKIAEVGTGLRVPGGARVLEGASLTPGLVDADSRAGLETGGRGNEESSEITPALRVLDVLDPKSRALERLARQGVTAVFLSPDTRNVIGGLGAVVKTAGEPVAARVVKAAGALRATMGDDPSRGNIPLRFGTPTNFYFRRPTTRMGVVWLFRKSFFDAAEYRKRGRDAPRDENLEVLAEVLDGKRPLRIAARRSNDLRTAMRLAEEFGFAIQVDGAEEGYRCAEDLKRRGIPVVAGPIEIAPTSFSRRAEIEEPCLGNAAILEKAGVLLALTANDRAGEEALPGQAIFAARYGLPFDAALAAVTLNPAKILGVEARLGSIEPGKDADLVLWSGAPLKSRPLAVLIDGRVVYDAAADPALAAGPGAR
jgi:imidazolonepropionase-like amidohydrolase